MRGGGAAEVEEANVYPQVDYKRVPVVNGLGVVTNTPLHEVIKHDVVELNTVEAVFNKARGYSAEVVQRGGRTLGVKGGLTTNLFTRRAVGYNLGLGFARETFTCIATVRSKF